MSHSINTTATLSNGSNKSTKMPNIKKPKVIAVFYKGAPWGGGAVIDNPDNASDTGAIFNEVQSLANNINVEFEGIIIGPDVIPYGGVINGRKHIEEFYEKGDQIIIYGYSYGGDNALSLANSEKIIDAMVIVDSADGTETGFSVDRIVPENVKITLNFYQTSLSGESSGSIRSRGFKLKAEGSNIVENIDLTNKDVTHHNIQKHAKGQIISFFNSRISTCGVV